MNKYPMPHLRFAGLLKHYPYLLSWLLLLSILSFNSCQKNDGRPALASNGSAAIKDKINNWLAQKSHTTSGDRIGRIRQLQESLDFDQAYTEDKGNKERVMIIPVRQGFTSFYNREKLPETYLSVTESYDGRIQYGVILLYFPNRPGSRLPRQVFAEINTGKKVMMEGTLAYLTVFDRFLYAASYSEGRRTSLVEPKKKTELPQGDASSVATESVQVNSTICTDWYWVTTYYYTDGTSEVVDVTYAGRTCREGCLPNEWCAPQAEDSGTGGGEGEYTECSLEEDDADAILASFGMEVSADGGNATPGTEYQDNGIIKKPVIIQKHRVTYRMIGSDPPVYYLTFSGIGYKNGQNDTWKWETLRYNGFIQTSGSTMPCLAITPTAVVAGPVISEAKDYAEWVASISATLTITCKIGAKYTARTTTYKDKYYASHFLH